MKTRSLFSILILIPAIIQAAEPLKHNSNLAYINTNYENASPLYWEIEENGKTIQIYLVYDRERNSPNRANGHWNFELQAQPGSEFKLILNNLENIWNGKPGFPLSERTLCHISNDGENWRAVQTEVVDENKLKMDITMETDSLYVTHLEPYTLSDLETLIGEIKHYPLVEITPIGYTVQNRPLEIIRIGKPNAPHRVFLRARAHPWEPGGNWVAHGLVKSLTSDDPVNEKYLGRYALYIMPMANKDGVVEGKTRFNMNGMDLNRDWDRPADPQLAPENYSLEQWFKAMIQDNKKIDFAIDLHNDQSGRIHIMYPEGGEGKKYLDTIDRYEALMREHTWFTEGRTNPSFRNPGTIYDGLRTRFGVMGIVQELNANWVAGRNEPASAENWMRLGRDYRKVFYYLFEDK